MTNEDFLYLVKVEPNANNNKYYKMIKKGDMFDAQYGRIGNTNHQTKTYSMSRWDSTLRSKLKKGYEDQTRLFAVKVSKVKSEYSDIPNRVIQEIVDRLQIMANNAIKENYTISSSNVTQIMIDEAQTELNKLMSADKMELFNAILLTLFKIIPRKMTKVNLYLAKDKDDFGRIIQEEQDLLDVMKGQVVQNLQKDEDENSNEEDVAKKNKNILEAMGLEVEETNDEDIKAIKKLMGRDSDKLINSWKVNNIETRKRFEKFNKENDIKDIRLLFHGTRSENVWSIMQTGLFLRPTNAVITGSMFGKGLYKSNDFDKSRGYTSVSGSRWANGGTRTGFMFLMDVAYGNPYNVYSFDSKYYSMDYKSLKDLDPSYNCLHAHGGTGMLRKDEIVIYSEKQCTMKYLIEVT